MDANQGLKISRILHAGYIFQSESARIAFDPIFENPFSKNCYAFPAVHFDLEQIKEIKFDAVFISHFHDDHCSFESLDLIDRQTPIYMFCVYEEMFSMLRELGFQNVFSLDLNIPIVIKDIEIIPRRALDQDVDCLFQIKSADLNILNVVDSWIDPETHQVLVSEAPWDLILWPFQTLRELEVLAPTRVPKEPIEIPKEWLDQLKLLNPRYIIPSSCQFQHEPWSWYNHALFPISYAFFQATLESILPETKMTRLDPGQAVEMTKNSLRFLEPLSWITPGNPQDLVDIVDYGYLPEAAPQATAEISTYLPPLGATESRRVFDYCQKGLLEKYCSLEEPLDKYFEKPRRWRLSVYDHLGAANHFFYLVHSKSIELCDEVPDRLAWTTEIPAIKLFGALELGESLTSMYIRINDAVFAPTIEAEIIDVDLVEDPLIRCLFTGNFGIYQKTQLQQIQQRRTKKRLDADSRGSREQ